MSKVPKKRNKKYRAPDPNYKRTSTAMMRLNETSRSDLKDTPFYRLVNLLRESCTPYCVRIIRFRIEYTKVVASLVNETEEVLLRAQKATEELEAVMKSYLETKSFSLNWDSFLVIVAGLNVADRLDDLLLRREMLTAYAEVTRRMKKDPVFGPITP